MNKSITVSCVINDKENEIVLSYETQVFGDTHKIVCSVVGNTIPNWLQLRKFEMASLKEKNKYIPLFNEINNGKNMATVLFIDKAYTDIMASEKLKILDMAGDVEKVKE